MADIRNLRIEETISPPRRRRVPLVWVAATLLVAVGAAGWLVRDRLVPSAEARAVEVYTVPSAGQSADGGGGFTAGGYLEVIPPGPVSASAMIPGRVKSISVVEGEAVNEGQEVARLDDTVFRQDVEAADAAASVARTKLARLEAGFRTEEIEQARGDFDAAQARLKQAEASLKRSQELSKIGAVPEKELAASAAELGTAKALAAARKAELDLKTRGTRPEDIAVAKAEMVAAESALARAKWALEAAVIRAPIAGVVLERFAEVGSWLAPASGIAHSGAILNIADPKNVQAWVDVNQRDLGRVTLDQRVTLVTDAQPNRPVKAQVARIMPRANLQKNTVQVKVQIPDPPADLRPEMSVKVTFLPPDGKQAERLSSALTIPASAVLNGDSTQPAVYVVSNGRARLKTVELAERSTDRAVIRSGISPGEQIVVNPAGVSDGQPITAKR